MVPNSNGHIQRYAEMISVATERNIKDPLALTEILSKVFVNLDESQLDDICEWTVDATKSLVTCALVCSRWSDVALELLWKHPTLRTFVDLLMDDDYLELEKKVSKSPLFFFFS